LNFFISHEKMSFTVKITDELIRSVDPAEMGKAIREMGSHLRDAATLTNNALANLTLPARSDISSIVLAGLGGSAIGGDLVRSYLADSLSVPMAINRTYSLPGYVGKNTLVIASSYSGDTEESLSMFADAKAKGAKIVCITTGGKIATLAQENNLPLIILPKGFQPRAGLAYSFVPILLLLEKLGFTKDEAANIEDAAKTLDSLAAKYNNHSSSDNLALSLATKLNTKIPVIYSSNDVIDTVNLRWRGQIQENAKHVAFGNILPEMNHNEINGWDHPRSVLDTFAVIFLRSPKDEHERVAKRFGILKDVLHQRNIQLEEVTAEGNSRLARMFSLVSLGDWISYYMALLSNVDPSPVPVISFLKKKLEE
jgi:glucose/mannose-6-phosphate isomerase